MPILIVRRSVPATVVGSLSFPGGASSSNSASVRIPRTGAMDVDTFTLEMWLTASATDADNGQEIAEGAAYNGTNGNIIWDADSVNTRGFIIGLSAGQLYLSVNTSGGARTLIGTTDMRDGQRRHVAIYRNASSGLMELFVAGNREDTITGPTGLVTYDGDAPTTDSYHYLCKEKLNATFGCDCLLSEIRVSNNQRYSGATYTVPTSAFTADANTVGLYHMSEQSGTTMGDSSGNGHNGELVGNPVPSWSSQSPF